MLTLDRMGVQAPAVYAAAARHAQRLSGLEGSRGFIALGQFQGAIAILDHLSRARDLGFDTAEWGFAIGSAFWGTGVFGAAATLALDFAFRTLETHRLEARASLQNGRGQGALLKLGAVKEGVLRKALRRGDEVLDQALYTILADEWRDRRSAPSADDARRVAVH